MKTVLTIAGSDCSGGAGIQADLKTMAALGVYGMSVITSVVAENTRGVLSSFDVPEACVADQLDAVFGDIGADAVKIGMLPSEGVMRLVADRLMRYKPAHIVADPVMLAKDGSPLMREEAIPTFLGYVLPLTTLLTPNIPEAERITGMQINSVGDMKAAAEKIVAMGAKTALVKGGHFEGDPTDVFYDGKEHFTYTRVRIKTKNTHGTGCTLSSAIASFIARGESYPEAIRKAKEYISGAISHALELGHGHGPTHHFYEFYDEKGERL